MNNLLQVPKARILAMQWLDFEDLARNETEFRKKWKNNNSCECIVNLEDNQLPWCSHVKKEFNKKYYAEIKILTKRSLALTVKSISSNKYKYDNAKHFVNIAAQRLLEENE